MDLDTRDQNGGAAHDTLGQELQAQEGVFPLESEPLELLPGDETAPSNVTAPADLILPDEPVGLSAEESEKRKRRRQQWEQDQEAKRRWELQRRLADISTDVELLGREVGKVRSELHVPLPPLATLPDFERQTLESAHNRRLSDIIYSHCRKTLGSVLAHKWSWPFNAPVDINIYKDYLEKVKTPMDFGTIKKRLEGKEYTHPDQFLTDVRLVFDNAKIYNKPGSDVHVMAVTLSEKFEEKYAAAVASRVTEESSVAEAEAMAARRRYAGAAAAAGGAAREAAESRASFLVKYIDQVTSCIADAKSAAAALCHPVSRAEKEALATALGRLPQAQFEAAIGIVMHHHPGLQPFDEVGFDLDMLDALTLRQLASFVAAAEEAAGGSGSVASGLVDGGAGAGTGRDGGKVQWPAVPVGSGLRPFAQKRKKKGGTTVVERAVTPAQDAVDGGTAEPMAGLEHATPATALVVAPNAASEVPVPAVGPAEVGAAQQAQQEMAAVVAPLAAPSLVNGDGGGKESEDGGPAVGGNIAVGDDNVEKA